MVSYHETGVRDWRATGQEETLRAGPAHLKKAEVASVLNTSNNSVSLNVSDVSLSRDNERYDQNSLSLNIWTSLSTSLDRLCLLVGDEPFISLCSYFTLLSWCGTLFPISVSVSLKSHFHGLIRY